MTPQVDVVLGGLRPRMQRGLFDEALIEVSLSARRADSARHGSSGGVYAYRTAEGARWRFVYPRSDGTPTTKRGFASELRAMRGGG